MENITKELRAIRRDVAQMKKEIKEIKNNYATIRKVYSIISEYVDQEEEEVIYTSIEQAEEAEKLKRTEASILNELSVTYKDYQIIDDEGFVVDINWDKLEQLVGTEIKGNKELEVKYGYPVLIGGNK